MGKITDRVNKTLNPIVIKNKIINNNYYYYFVIVHRLFQKNLTLQDFYSTLIDCNNLEV